MYIIFHTVLYIPKCTLFSKLENKVHFGAVDIGVLASVLAGTTPLAAFAHFGEFTGLENREPLLLDTRRGGGGERTRVRRSLFGGGGAGTVESDSQSAIPRCKSGLDSTHSEITSRLGLTNCILISVSQHLRVHVFSCFQGCFLNRSVYHNKPVKLPRTLVHYGKYCTWVWSQVLISHSAVPRALLASRPHPRAILSIMHLRGNLTSIYVRTYMYIEYLPLLYSMCLISNKQL